jgi:hypothetical protein
MRQLVMLLSRRCERAERLACRTVLLSHPLRFLCDDTALDTAGRITTHQHSLDRPRLLQQRHLLSTALCE